MPEHHGEYRSDAGAFSVQLASLAYEIRILVEVLSMGIQSLVDHPQAAPLRNELEVLAKLAGQGTEALAALDAALDEPAMLRAGNAA